MKLLCCELKKLFNNRMPWLLLAVLLTANVFSEADVYIRQ